MEDLVVTESCTKSNKVLDILNGRSVSDQILQAVDDIQPYFTF